MQLPGPSQLQCCGRVKYSGIDTGNVTWKNGVLILENTHGGWKMNLEYDVCRGKPQKSYVLHPGVIKKLICKAQLVIELHPSGCSTMNFHLIPHSPKDDRDKVIFHEKLLEIQRCTDEPLGVKSEVKMTPCKPLVSKINSSPEAFTSVKSRESRKRSFNIDDSSDEEGKENSYRKKSSSGNFLERAEEKSKGWSSSLTTPVKFYGNSLQNTYSNYSAKRTPGLMPDPTPRKGLVNYSWTRPKPTITNSSTQQQPNLHGFSNLGNTCYMNAILQSLVNLDTFTTDLLYGNKRILKTLESTSLYKCMVQVFTSRLKVVSDFSKREYLKNLKHAISSSAKRFSGFQQHDAHEFLGLVLDQLKEEMTKLAKSTPSSHRDEEDVEIKDVTNPTVQNFEFEVLHSIRCENCGEEVTKEEQFHDLSVDMPRNRDPMNPRSLQDALELSLKKEKIEYSCEKCSCGKAEVTHKFTKLPRVLVLHLKRYSYNMMMSKQAKAGQNLSIPRYLTLQSHCIEETRPPFPTIPPPESKSLTIPDSPLREKHENTPRRRLDTNPTFKFKPSRVLRDFDDDPEKTSTQQTSTPYKKLKEDPEIITDRKITLDDENDDPELAKALELSLKEANDRAQGYYDEVDGCAPDNNFSKVLEMSRPESEARNQDHDYEKNIGVMTEEEQIELAMKRSMMEFELLQNSFQDEDRASYDQMECDAVDNTYSPEDIRRECSSAVANDLFKNKKEVVSSKYCMKEQGSELKQCESESKCQEPVFKTNCSPVKNCENGTTFHELSENNYFHSGEKLGNSGFPDKEDLITSNNEGIDGCVNRGVNGSVNTVNEIKSDDEVMIISDGSFESEVEKEIMPRKSNYSGTDILDAASNDVCSIKPKYRRFDSEEKPKLSTDLQNIFMVDEMTADDIKPIRTVIHERSSGSSESVAEQISGKKPDIVDLFCSEDDDFLIDQWDKENYNPDKELDEALPRIDNEKGDLPYSYRLVSIVNHIGSSSVVGHYVSDVYDIKKASWFSCDDSHVSKTAETDVRSKRERTGYIFFYLHKDIFDDLKDHYALHSKKHKVLS